ncbi:VWA domain-containing protein [Crocosphaera sp.]|uniref:vWA domain-containing protein n=1 Tax=Crocosphaera sp. TaxID=2729996 RepID=UPI00262A2F96|nr:VWA domain-containing protein [Crocosphaera sp.]MDJ0580449.1 VWA domain-containing protein [Crocosphaera sp.]
MSGDSRIENRDYTLMIDKSSSMATSDGPDGKTRWQIAQESTLALADKCEEIDPDGITVYVFSGAFKRYDNVTSDKVTKVYEENQPMGQTDLASVLQDAFEDYFKRKEAGTAKANGETFLIITDGEPTDRKAVISLIMDAAQKVDREDELGISFIQVGTDKDATRFFKALDDDLQGVGAKFDIVDTVTVDNMKGMSLTDVLLNALID